MLRRRFFYQETPPGALFRPNLTSDRHVLRLVRKPMNQRVSSWAIILGIFRTYFSPKYAQNMPKYAEICPNYHFSTSDQNIT